MGRLVPLTYMRYLYRTICNVQLFRNLLHHTGTFENLTKNLTIIAFIFIVTKQSDYFVTQLILVCVLDLLIFRKHNSPPSLSLCICMLFIAGLPSIHRWNSLVWPQNKEKLTDIIRNLILYNVFRQLIYNNIHSKLIEI